MRLRVETPARDVGGDRADRVDQLGATAVVERERQREPAVRPGELLGLLDPLPHPARHPAAAAADEPHAHALAVQLVAALHEQPLVEPHEVAHLVERAAPVLGRERVDGEPAQPDLERAFDRVEERLLPRRVPVGAFQAPPLRPAAVAVHHHRDVTRDPLRVEVGHDDGSYLPDCAVPDAGASSPHSIHTR